MTRAWSFSVLALTCISFSVPLVLCVEADDVIKCNWTTLDSGTLPNLDIAYDCRNPENVNITVPLGTNRTSPFKLFHSHLCVTRLPQNICEYPNIASIKFDRNSVKSIPSLSCLKNLIALDISNNNVEIITKDTFTGLSNLRYINLRFNRINYIEPYTFKEDLRGLMFVLLDGNRLTTVEVAWFMSIKQQFCRFGLSYNEIGRFTNKEKWLVDQSQDYGPGFVDLSNNHFITWITAQLKIYGIEDLRTLGKFMKWGFDFRNNPWRCDCAMHEFLKLASNFPDVIWRNYFEVYCRSPAHLNGTRITDVPLAALVCNVTEKCPVNCFCQDQLEKGHVLVDCRNGNLSHLPLDLPYGSLKVLLSNNSITSLDPRPYLGRSIYVDISRNSLNYISTNAVSLLQHNVKTLNLSNNKLRYLPKSIQNIPFERLVIDNNLFDCACNSTWMFRWLKRQEKDISDIKCSAFGGNIIEAVQADDNFLRCHVGNPFPRVLSILFGTLGVLFIVTVILLVVFRYEALIIMHTNLKRLQKPREGNLDHDVFVSVEEETETDRVWAVNTLLPELEQKHNLKVYFALRDMDPGTVIADETIKVLRRSHTALIILSSNYLENPSKVFEFYEAYKIMVRQRQGCLIIIRSPEVTASRQAYVNAFIRLKKYVDREAVNLFEKIVKDVEKESSKAKYRITRSVSQIEVLSA